MSNLLGKRILITRAKAQAESFKIKLSELGANVILFPTIEIIEMDDYNEFVTALNSLDQYDWLILTSVNTVQILVDQLKKLGIDQLPKTLKTACIGPKTEAAFKKQGFRSDLMPQKFVAEYILPGLSSIKGKKFLLPQADKARKFLADSIRENGGEIDDLIIYKTVMPPLPKDSVNELQAGVDLITFTSPSTIINLSSMTRSIGLDLNNLPGDPSFACIGPVTAEAARDLEIPVSIIPEDYSVDGLITAMIQFYEGEKQTNDQ